MHIDRQSQTSGVVFQSQLDETWRQAVSTRIDEQGMKVVTIHVGTGELVADSEPLSDG